MIREHESVLILDFGSQYTQLIARRVRELHVYSEIHPFDVSLDVVRRLAPEGIILSGGPASVYDADAPMPRPEVLELLRTGMPPVLGICYGMGVLNLAFGGSVDRAAQKEFGPADVRVARVDPRRDRDETARECPEAGASNIHFHARNADGSPCHAPEVYAEIVAKIRERTDILIDSTLGQITVSEDENRLAHIRLMGQQSTTRPDFAAVDTGSPNIDAYDREKKAFRTLNKVYLNSTETCLFLAKGMTEAGVKPHLSVWAVPFVRMVEAFLDMGAIREPAYVQCVLAEGGIVVWPLRV